MIYILALGIGIIIGLLIGLVFYKRRCDGCIYISENDLYLAITNEELINIKKSQFVTLQVKTHKFQ